MICTRLQRFSRIPHSQSRINFRAFVLDFAVSSSSIAVLSHIVPPHTRRSGCFSWA